MSNLRKLIQELCPDGVEYVPIGAVVSYEQPSKYIVHNTDYNNNFETPVLTAGQSFVLGYTNEKDGVYAASKKEPVIIFDDFTGAFKWVDFPFKVKSSALKMLHVDNNRALIRYIFHLMGNINFTSNEHKRLWIGIYSAFEIPLPPLEVQGEIVRILDNFTELTADLTAELTARKQQYEYYRDYLLNVEGRCYSLAEVCQIIDCPHSSPKWKTKGVPVIRNYNLVEGRISMGNLSYVDEEEYYQRTKRAVPQAGDLLFSREAPIGNVAIIPNEFTCCQGQRVVLLKPRKEIVLPKFLMYSIQGSKVKNQIAKIEKMGSTVSNFNISDMRKLMLIIPSLSEQEKIISKLELFDRLLLSIKSGLPAEIDARKKQYRYYRDKLFSFKEKAI